MCECEFRISLHLRFAYKRFHAKRELEHYLIFAFHDTHVVVILGCTPENFLLLSQIGDAQVVNNIPKESEGRMKEEEFRFNYDNGVKNR